jgi:hypothetical protein
MLLAVDPEIWDNIDKCQRGVGENTYRFLGLIPGMINDKDEALHFFALALTQTKSWELLTKYKLVPHPEGWVLNPKPKGDQK